MRVLLIKTSSMGDVIHTLPALTDANKVIENFSVDWVVEDAFTEIPRWHPSVREVFPISLRRWRKNIFSHSTRKDWRALQQQLKAQTYDYILDAQGLIKSAFLTRYAKGVRVGLDWSSARESLASIFYQQKHTVNFYQHAIVRMRQLFSTAFAYSFSQSTIDYGLTPTAFTSQQADQNYIVFLHGTTWDTKLWPERYWLELAKMVTAAGINVKISGGNDQEVERAGRIAAVSDNIQVLPRLTITKMASLLAYARGAVGVDTGFCHLAAALSVPTVSIYGATDPHYTGALGPTSLHLTSKLPCSPCLSRQCTYRGSSLVTPACYQEISPQHVWDTLKLMLR